MQTDAINGSKQKNLQYDLFSYYFPLYIFLTILNGEFGVKSYHCENHLTLSLGW